MGIFPNVALFRHFYHPHLMNRDATGSVTFVLRNPNEYINMERMNTTAEWRHKWCWVFFEEPNKSLAEPTGPPG